MYTSETNVFYCQIDSCRALKEYQQGGRCVRMLAVEEQFFESNTLERKEGVKVFSIEVSYWTFLQLLYGRLPDVSKREKFDLLDESVEARSRWYRLKVEWDTTPRDGYAYPTFSEEQPRFFRLLSCGMASQNIHLLSPPSLAEEVLNLSVPDGDLNASTPSTWTLSAFHVGQGMCSIVSNKKRAYLLDIGAGKPVIRPLYQGKKIRNDLARFIDGIDTIDIVLSHADQDHWRILAWDSTLRKKIRHIYVPKGAKSLAYKDPAIKFDIKAIERLHVDLSANSWLDIYRSAPTQNDDNGHCLVTVFESAGKRALIAGDYVYSRIRTDTNTYVAELHAMDFDAVIVPHHGDAESANEIVKARQGAVAFFSAGDNLACKHPTQVSRDSHINEKYREICDNYCPDIKRVLLI
ncbi:MULTISPECIES: hypothetical protein [Pseudomonas]|uniref:Metallo-beta-lactamase domain-containing protein n=1 Tax=Pseudomonas aphyarum TaxID=2942629 RepID=A0ABT5PPV5_9PSED|nr:hypothetical protein [Pseudomonas aphyarum]MDD0971103.1 hypothetical protein [Pseudomonas aphyarum]MDD1125931.1 hypothetical protein [Pseudomonas aphyarum]